MKSKTILEAIKSSIAFAIEKVVTVVTIAIISWVLGAFTNHFQTAKEIKGLKADVKDLEWGVEYYQKQ